VTGFTFLHAADLHLGAPFRGLGRRGTPEAAARLAAAPFAAFRRIAKLARRERAAFLLLAGDIFDSRELSLASLAEFRKTLEFLGDAGIRVFAVAGNHDYLPWPDAFDAPENFRLFPAGTADAETVRIGGEAVATVAGISHGCAAEKRDLVPQLAAALRGAPGFRIALLHANIGGIPGFEPYAPAPLSELLDSGAADYWALGHVHTPAILAEEPAAAVYPGSPQGRSVIETGARCARLVRVGADRRIEIEAHPVDEIRFEVVSVEAPAGARNFSRLRELLGEAARRAADGAPGEVLLRVVFRGATPLNDALRREDPEELHRLCAGLLPPGCRLESVRIATAAPLAASRREGLAAEVEAVRGALPGELRDYLASLRLPSRTFDAFSDEEFETIADDAANLLIDRLAGAGGGKEA